MPTTPPDIPVLIGQPLNALVVALQQQLGANLIGIYLHGSLAMGCFNPAASDVDLLVVVTHRLVRATKRQIAATLLSASDAFPQNGLEISLVTLAAAQNFEYPTTFELHFSEMWRDRYLANTVNFDEEQSDPDLAAHFTITRTRGWCLVGWPIKDVFGEVPEKYYRASILNDAQDILADIGRDPVYGVLNLCRVLAYLSAGQITSKAEGGAWALNHLDSPYTSLIQRALDVYRDSCPLQRVWDVKELAGFASDMRQRIASHIS